MDNVYFRINKDIENVRTAYINLGFKCINNCLFCAVADVRSSEMSTADAKRAIAFSHEKGCKSLTFSGGEVTIREDLSELVDYARNMGFNIAFQTNARLLADYDLCKTFLDGNVSDFYVSLHGSTSGIHDSITGIEGSFSQTVQALRNLTSVSSLLNCRIESI